MTRPPFSVLLLVSVTAPLAAQTSLEARVDSVFRQYASTESPGCVIGVAQHGRVLLERAYGMADLERGVPLGPASILEAGSVSKQFTAAAVLLLARDGKLSLDDPVRRWVPEVPDFGGGVAADAPAPPASHVRSARLGLDCRRRRLAAQHSRARPHSRAADHRAHARAEFPAGHRIRVQQ